MKHKTNCPNCGAVLNGTKCEYCGTQFYDNQTIVFPNEISIENTFKPITVKLTIRGKDIKCYIANVEINVSSIGCGLHRNGKGILQYTKTVPKHQIKMTLMEIYNMKRNSYITIQGWMVTDLRLSGTELLVYAIIYGFSQDDTSSFEGTWSYLEEWTNASRSTIYRTLKSLIDKGYVTKTERSAGYTEYRDVENIAEATQSDFSMEYVGELTQEQMEHLTDLWNAQNVTRNVMFIKPMSTHYDKLRKAMYTFTFKQICDVIAKLDEQRWFAKRKQPLDFDWTMDNIQAIAEGKYEKVFLAKGEIDWENV